MNALIKLELARALRNKKFLFFSVLYPSMIYLIFSSSSGSDAKVSDTGLTVATYLMVSMASFGALTAVLMGNSERIAKERESGWVRQLRLTPLPGRGYVLAKTASAAVVSLPSIIMVFVVAAGDAVRPITMIVYFGLSILGGLWMPSTSFPQILQDIAKWLPTHAYAELGRAIEQSQAPSATDVAVLAVYFVLFAGGAAWLYRKDTLKA